MRTEFLDFCRSFWGFKDIDLSADIVADLSQDDEDSAEEFLLAVQERYGVQLEIDLSKHYPGIWSMRSVLSGIAPDQLIDRLSPRTEPLRLSEILHQIRERDEPSTRV